MGSLSLPINNNNNKTKRKKETKKERNACHIVTNEYLRKPLP